MTETRLCQYCQQEIEDGALACPHCGQAVALFDAYGQAMACPQCGKQIAADAARCDYCGSKIEVSAQKKRFEVLREFFSMDRLFDFHGVASRKEFVVVLLFSFLSVSVLGFCSFLLAVFNIIDSEGTSIVMGVVLLLVLSVIAWIHLAVSARRLRAVGKPPMYTVFLLVPGVNFVIYLLLVVSADRLVE